MQNNSNKLITQDENDPDKQFSLPVKEYQKRVVDIIAWLYSKEEELKLRPRVETLHDAEFSILLDEYSRHDKFITEFSEYCQTIMKCKEVGQDIRDNEGIFSDEDRDEVGIQLDAMMVCHEKLKILIYDRLHNLRAILEKRQQTQIEQFEERLSWFEKKLENITFIGPDYEAIKMQMKEINNLSALLEEQQDILNFISNIVIFDEVDPVSLQIRSRSSSTLDVKLESINDRWKEVCRTVQDRNDRLIHAEVIWKNFLEGEKIFSKSLSTIENKFMEMLKLADNIADIHDDKVFIDKLKARYNKIVDEISRQQSFYTRMEESIKNEINKINDLNDDSCSLLIEKLLDNLNQMEINWHGMMNGKRKFDRKLELLENPNLEQMNYTTMIPLPDPITSTSNNDLRFSNLTTNANNNSYGRVKNNQHEQMNRDATFQSLNDDTPSSTKDLLNEMNGSYSAGRDFDNSISSDSRSLFNNNNSQLQDKALYTNNITTTTNDSQDELSTTSLTASYPIISIPRMINDNTYGVQFNSSGQERQLHLETSNYNMDNIQHKLHLNKQQHYHNITSNCHGGHNTVGESHNCRVEEWKDSLESFSTWLKQVETSLDIPSTLETIVGASVATKSNNQSYSRLNAYRQLLLIYEIETRISSTCQDEFDCLLLLGHEIIEDLLPEIGENEFESNSNKLRDILADIEMRYATVKKCLNDRKNDITNEDRWIRLLKTLQNSCAHIINLLAEIIPENEIGVDLITLAQQQDQLMHLKADLDENDHIKSSIQDAEMFLKICDFLQTQLANQNESKKDSTQIYDINSDTTNNDNTILQLWMSFKNFKEDIEKNRDSLLIHFSELSHTIQERLNRLDKVHNEMHALQHKLQELASKLQVAEILRSNWVIVENLTIEELSEQLEDLKIYRERVNEIESIHQSMNSILDWMTELDIPLSQQNLKRISELNDIWNLIQISIEDRQKSIEQAFDNQSSSEQRFLNQTLNDLSPRWERRVATSKVPYFIDHETNKTHWDHPKFDDLLKTMSGAKQYIFSAYRTAFKLRLIQRKFGIDMLMLEQLKDILEIQIDNQLVTNNSKPSTNQAQTMNNNDNTLIGVEQVIFYLKAIYERIKNDENSSLDVPLSIDLTLNWLLNLYDSTRTGYVSALSLKVGLALICCATREEKYIYMYNLVSNQRTGNVDARKLGTLFETCMRIPIYLGEGDSFGGSEIIESSIRNCFSMSKYDPQSPNSIDLSDYLSWLKSEPQFIIWLPVLHRLLISEHIRHQIRCKLCGASPIIGLRYRCLKCFKFNICQNCFLTGRHIHEHFDPIKHPMQEYCNTTSSGDNVRDFTKILKNKLKPKSMAKRVS